MSFWKWNKKLNPLVALLTGFFIIIYGLITAKTIECSYFLLSMFVLLMIFGCWKQCLHILPMFIVVSGVFSVIAYFATGTYELSFSMFNRFGTIFLGIVPGMATEPVRMTRSLSGIKAPRSVTLGMLIAMSFVPMLIVEVKRVREAMKTRGAGSIWNPRIFYRALLIPFVMRLVNISDTLSLSVETRGFSLGKVPYTIYNRPDFVVSDLISVLLSIVAGGVFIIL